MRRLAFLLLGIIFSTLVFLPIVRADDLPQQGVNMTVYDGVMIGLGPWQQEPEQPVCFSGVVSMIDFDWGGAPAAEGCPRDRFMVHFTGWLTVPESGQWEFLNWSDDGWYMTLDGVLTIDDWNFHGCGGHWSGPNEGYSQLVAGQSYALDVWMFEWGGGACARLWYGSPSGYGVVPTEWLTTSAVPAPSPTPSPEPSLEPSALPTIEPSPTESPSLEPTATPAESQVPSYEPSPIPSPTPTPQPSPTPKPSPVPSATDSPSPDPTALPSESPSVAPSVEPTPEPTSSPDNIGEQTVAAVGEAVAAVAETVSKAIEAIANLGKDLSPAEKQKAAPVAVAIIIGQVASAAVAAASSAASAARKADK